MDTTAVPDRLYFRQLLAGRDFAVGDTIATQMANYVYLIGDRDTAQAVVVDPAYRVDDIVAAVEGDGLALTGALVTHHHPDHVGGDFMGHSIEGLRDLLETRSVKIHVHADEAEWVRRTAGVSAGDLAVHSSGEVIDVGAVAIKVLHTPGHTPGSQCFLVDGMLVSGDTLFLDGCGRTDFPGSDPAAMYDSLQRLASLPDATAVFPGHHYSPESVATMAAVKDRNFVYKPKSKTQWLQMFGPRGR
ncbi:MAG: MBL fold metallo-hydrolase [Actinomycetota bacterium]|nr:MBL fold metallo-hydrolase [Actinomycetota bacterium]